MNQVYSTPYDGPMTKSPRIVLNRARGVQSLVVARGSVVESTFIAVKRHTITPWLSVGVELYLYLYRYAYLTIPIGHGHGPEPLLPAVSVLCRFRWNPRICLPA